MNIPEKIRVLHQTYQISEVDNLHDGADDLYGQVRYLEERILLNSGASGEAKKAALMHETIHVIDEMFQIGLVLPILAVTFALTALIVNVLRVLA